MGGDDNLISEKMAGKLNCTKGKKKITTKGVHHKKFGKGNQKGK